MGNKRLAKIDKYDLKHQQKTYSKKAYEAVH